jgi:Trk K+ transport system NAD-binding subunit
MLPPETRRDRLLRAARVHLSFVRVLVRQFRLSIGLFVIVVLVGGWIIWNENPEMTYAHAVYAALTLTFFEVSEDYPQGKGIIIQMLYFVLPAVGLTLIAESLVRFGVAVFNRRHMSGEWHMALASTFSDHVVVAGLGHVGRRVALQLARNERLVCIEVASEGKEGGGAGVGLPEDVAVILGDATRPDVLAKANVANARALLALTDNDLANLEIALCAREMNPKVRVVLRMFNETLGQRLVEQFKFDAVYSTSALAAPSFVSALYHSRILQTIQIGDGKVVHMAEFEVAPGSPLAGHTILEIEKLTGASVVLHQTLGKADLLPSAEARVGASDHLFVLCELSKIDPLERLARGIEG